MTIRTRFAPSPTGMLHIGGARTALFNYLFAKNQGGKFLLRIEDTDKKRSTNEAKQAITDGLKWLGLEYDEIIYQSENEKRHQEIAYKLLESGKAYYCYTPAEELVELRK
ncbi:MAG: glutamate--tRNA ligase family protein, partial [Proteobacteria bacterium]|nr:glutamate--tRNA ligase family protein [Pseudomonadota bacterium]